MTDFGTDVSFFPDLDPTLALVSGTRVLLEAILRRLSTPRGTFAWDPNYGFDVRMLLGESLDDSTLPVWQRAIETECEKDERVLSAEAAITSSGSSYAIAIALTTAAGPFAFTLGVSSVGIDVLSAPQS